LRSFAAKSFQTVENDRENFPALPRGKIQRAQMKFVLRANNLALGMDSSGDDHIAHLLRLKRYEQPPVDYFENFLHEFRRRQRGGLVRKPLWRVCFERGRYFVFWHNLWPLAYTGAAIVAVVAGSLIISIKPQQPDIIQLAAQTSPVSIRPTIIDKQVEFEPASFDIQPTLQPGSTDLLVLPASDEYVPLNLEWELREDQSLLLSP
jgi:hypothetical protein